MAMDLIEQDEQELQGWLRTQPVEVSVIILARSALQVVPTLAGFLSEPTSVADENRILLAFRSMAAAWVMGAWPTHAAELGAPARSAAADALQSATNFANVIRTTIVGNLDALDARTATEGRATPVVALADLAAPTAAVFATATAPGSPFTRAKAAFTAAISAASTAGTIGLADSPRRRFRQHPRCG